MWGATSAASDPTAAGREESTQTTIDGTEFGRIVELAGMVAVETATGERSTPVPGRAIRDGESLATGSDGRVWIEVPVENPYELEAWGVPGRMTVGADTLLEFRQGLTEQEGPTLWVIAFHMGSAHLMIGRSRERVYRVEIGSTRSSLRFGHSIVDAIVVHEDQTGITSVLLREGEIELEDGEVFPLMRAMQQVSIQQGYLQHVLPLDPELWNELEKRFGSADAR
jgi:hypothetical protein